MFNKRNLRLLAIMVSIGVMVLIICFSAQSSTESDDLSKSMAGKLLKLFQSVYPDLTLDGLNHFLRKLAHFTLYFILGCSLTSVFSRQQKISPILITILVGSAFAATDEIHQLFSDGRSGSVKDVLLDTCGVTTGSVLSYCVARLAQKRTE